ncbi:MAG: phage/plasmid primase, P4 family [Leucobacter sp.]
MSAEESRLAENEAATSEGLAEHSTCDQSIAVENASQERGESRAKLRRELIGLSEEHSTHARLAYRFAADALDRFVHVTGLGWHFYDGARWTVDEGNKRVAAALLETIRGVPIGTLTQPELDALNRNSGLRGTLEVAESIGALSVHYTKLDADPWALNCQNGTLDLRTMALREHSPTDFITKVTNAPYDPSARSELWERFLESSLPDPEVRGFVQRCSGIALVGKQLLHHLLVHHGAGRNGKGVFYQAKGHALGDYWHHAASDLFDVERGSSPNGAKPAMLALRGARYVSLSETAKQVKIDTARLKALTGDDNITGRMLYSNVTVQFAPSHWIELISNFLPQLPDDDNAVWERVQAVPWDVVIPREERDPELPEKLKAEGAAILAWMVAGLVEYNDRGLDAPEAVTAKTATYREDQNDLKRFIEDCCEEAPTTRDELSMAKLREAYVGWAQREGIWKSKVLDTREFKTALEKLGYSVVKTNRGMSCGLRLAVLEDANDEPTHEPQTPAQKQLSEDGKARAAAMLRATGGAKVLSGAPLQKAADAKPLADVPEEVFEPVG